MTQEELFSEIKNAHPNEGDFTYVERRGEDYEWIHTKAENAESVMFSNNNKLPDVWLYYSGHYPTSNDEKLWSEFFDDLLEEMESMAGGKDRCRWSFDNPYPHGH